jgi:hypothetical protein
MNFKKKLLAVIPENEEAYKAMQKAESPIDVLNMFPSAFGIDESKWPEWVHNVKEVCKEEFAKKKIEVKSY